MVEYGGLHLVKLASLKGKQHLHPVKNNYFKELNTDPLEYQLLDGELQLEFPKLVSEWKALKNLFSNLCPYLAIDKMTLNVISKDDPMS